MRAIDEMLDEKDSEESKITPRLRTVDESERGRIGGEIRGGQRRRNSDLELLSRRLREEVQVVISARIDRRREGWEEGSGIRNWISSA